MVIEIKGIKRFDGKGTYDQKFTQDENGKWLDESVGAVLEEDVIDFVKKHDRQNLNKYFPMYGFHN